MSSFYFTKKPAMETQEAALQTQPSTKDLSSEKSLEKKKRTRLWKEPGEGRIIVCFKNTPMRIIQDIKDQLEEDEQTDYPDACAKVLENKRVRVYPSAKKNRKRINAYRRTYSQTESYKQKHNTEEARQKVREYNRRPEVKLQKRIRQSAKNLLLREQKEKDPEYYEKKLLAKMEYVQAKKKLKLEHGGETARVQPISEKVDEKVQQPTQPITNTPIGSLPNDTTPKATPTTTTQRGGKRKRTD